MIKKNIYLVSANDTPLYLTCSRLFRISVLAPSIDPVIKPEEVFFSIKLIDRASLPEHTRVFKEYISRYKALGYDLSMLTSKYTKNLLIEFGKEKEHGFTNARYNRKEIRFVLKIFHGNWSFNQSLEKSLDIPIAIFWLMMDRGFSLIDAINVREQIKSCRYYEYTNFERSFDLISSHIKYRDMTEELLCEYVNHVLKIHGAMSRVSPKALRNNYNELEYRRTGELANKEISELISSYRRVFLRNIRKSRIKYFKLHELAEFQKSVPIV